MPVQERIVVLHAGEGAIEPTDEYTDEQVVQASDEIQKPVEDPHVVCMDERNAIEGKEPVREKNAGGNLATALVMAAAAKWSGFTQAQIEAGPDAMVEEIADTLTDNGESLGAHRHAPNHDPTKTGCGAVDKMLRTFTNIAEHALDEDMIEQAKIDLGDNFNMEHWKAAHAGISALAQDPKWLKWRTARIQEVVEERGGVVETLDAEKDAFKDPENKRHGHWGEAARINSKAGFSNDRDNARIPTFQADADPIIREAKIMGQNQEEFSLLLHVGVMFQYGTTYTLTKNMRIIR